MTRGPITTETANNWRQRHKAAPGECATCDAERAEGNDFHPPHDPSPRCESGKRTHCSCDTCF